MSFAQIPSSLKLESLLHYILAEGIGSSKGRVYLSTRVRCALPVPHADEHLSTSSRHLALLLPYYGRILIERKGGLIERKGGVDGGCQY
jgi:hypothetical protein